MANAAAGQPFYETSWLSVLGILLLSIPIGIACLYVVTGLLWGLRSLRRLPPFRRYFILLVAVPVVVFIGLVALSLASFSPIHGGSPGPAQVPQVELQQQLSADEKALDQGQLEYLMPPTLLTNRPFLFTVTVTDLGKHPHSRMTIKEYMGVAGGLLGVVIYDHNVPTGGILGLSLTCPSTLYCQAIGDARQAIVGTGSDGSWSWNITPLRPGATSAIITAMTYDGTSNFVLAEEDIPVSLEIQEGAWSDSLDTWWGTTTTFATTTAGQITTLGGAVTVIAGGVAWVRSRPHQPRLLPPIRSPLKNGNRHRTEGVVASKRLIVGRSYGAGRGQQWFTGWKCYSEIRPSRLVGCLVIRSGSSSSSPIGGLQWCKQWQVRACSATVVCLGWGVNQQRGGGGMTAKVGMSGSRRPAVRDQLLRPLVIRARPR